jgi:transcription elongation factor Elf1
MEDLPLELFATIPSRCHKKKSRIVRKSSSSLEVRANCVGCGKPDYIYPDHIPRIPCPICGTRMVVSRLKEAAVYEIACSRCERALPLAEVVPEWSDKFFLYHEAALFKPPSGP